MKHHQKVSYQMRNECRPVCNFIVLKKHLFKCPFNRYELHAFSSNPKRQLTDHYNYGFNHITMALYTKVCSRIRQAHKGHSGQYHSMLEERYRFNDEMPLDFGGLGPPIDQQLQSLVDVESLFKQSINFRLFYGKRANPRQPFEYPLFLNMTLDLLYQDKRWLAPQSPLQQYLSLNYSRSIDRLSKHTQNTNHITQQEHTQTQSSQYVNPYDQLLAPTTVKRQRSPTLHKDRPRGHKKIKKEEYREQGLHSKREGACPNFGMEVYEMGTSTIQKEHRGIFPIKVKQESPLIGDKTEKRHSRVRKEEKSLSPVKRKSHRHRHRQSSNSYEEEARSRRKQKQKHKNKGIKRGKDKKRHRSSKQRRGKHKKDR